MMAKGRETHERRPKPLLAAAVFCSRMLEGTDGTLSAIRIIDSYTAFLPPGALAHPDQRIPVSLKALLAFKSGDVVGNRTLKLVLRIPTGKRRKVLEQTLSFNGGPQGINIKFNLELKLKTQGLYWIEVVVDGVCLTQMPLQVSFETLEQAEDLEQPGSRSS